MTLRQFFNELTWETQRASDRILDTDFSPLLNALGIFLVTAFVIAYVWNLVDQARARFNEWRSSRPPRLP